MVEITPVVLTPPEDLPPYVEWPPTQDELPSSDGIPMETQRHKLQMDLLIDSLELFWTERQDFYIGGDMFLYFSLEQVRGKDFRGPDFFVVLDVPKRERKSWVVWEEGKGPDVVIELLSESTAARDKGEKQWTYQTRLRVPEYFWFDPFNSQDWAGFGLKDGVYEPIAPDEQGRLLSQQLGLALVRWPGSYREIEAEWLRWMTLEGVLLPTPQELAEQERQRAEQEWQRAEQERQRAERLAAQLRALGIEPEEA